MNRPVSPFGIWEPTLFGPLCVGWRRKWIEVRECDTASADEMVEAHHYSGKATQNRFLSLGVYAPTIRAGMLGVLQLGYGIRPAIKGTWGGQVTGENSREFDRMWLDDCLPKFSESIALSCLEHYLHARWTNVRFLITYADGSTGRTGTIYKAANYTPCGSIPADFYILASGERVHPVTMWHRHGTRAWETLQRLYPGIRKAEGRQFRFIKDLRPVGRVRAVGRAATP